MGKVRFEKQANEMTVINVNNKQHVIRPFIRDYPNYPKPNYRNTGCAFVGILKKEETLNQFKTKWADKKKHPQKI